MIRLKKLVATTLIFSVFSSIAAETPQKKTFAEDVGATIKEVFVKGSIDGKNLILVYGMGDALKDSQELMENAIDMEELKYIGEDAAEDFDRFKNRIYSKEDDDYVDYGDIFEEMDATTESAKKIVTAPWKSLKKIPQAYKLTFQQAQDAYHGSDSKVGGALKFGGLAVWANVKGSYYLVIEAPAKMAGNILKTTAIGSWEITKTATWAVFHTAGLLIDETANLVGTTVKYSFQGIKIAGAATVSSVMTAYGAVSSSVATAATLVAAGGVSLYEGGRWVTSELPSKVIRPVQFKHTTDVEYTEHKNYMENIKENLISRKKENQDFDFKAKIRRYNSKLYISINYNGKKIPAFIIKSGIENKKVELKMMVTSKLVTAIKKHEHVSRKKVRKIAKEMAKDFLNQISL